KGNVIDPLEIIDQYGTDALRFTLSAMAAQARDIKLAVNRVEGYRNFATKLWNAARYCQMNGCEPVAGYKPVGLTQTVNRWIVGALADAATKVAESIDTYKFNEAAGAAYQFTWGTFCDWYMEFTKPILAGTDEAAKAETRATTAWVLDQILHILHPLMPFITEELWEQLSPTRANRLISAEWPEFAADVADPASRDEMDWVIGLVSGIRGVRSEMNIPTSVQMPVYVLNAGAQTSQLVTRYQDLVIRMARISGLHPTNADEAAQIAMAKGNVKFVLGGETVALQVAEYVDVEKERARLSKEIDKLTGEIKKIDAKLSNEQFVAKAPAEVIEEQRDRREAADQDRDKLQKALEVLAG
ncbi:class I tRNA ligase family protein, partial [Azospirillum sp. B506]|uniref:class I tRNA ligase family protein n=1 Tax=Azospirillum sp. B506 TaxID=137721 RepID=UPI0005B2C1BA